MVSVMNRLCGGALSLSLVFSLAFFGCASHPSDEQLDAVISRGDYEHALSLQKKKSHAAKDTILENLDRSLLLHWAKRYDASRVLMNSTDSLMMESARLNLARSFGTAVLNDTTAAYPGTVYEYLYLNAFNALNYYNADMLEDALVEVRKLQAKQEQYVSAYGAVALAEPHEDDEQTEKASDAVRQFGVNQSDLAFRGTKPTADNVFRDSATVRYVSMALRSADGDNGDGSGAALDARYVTALSGIDTSEDAEIPYGMGRLNVLAFTGRIGRRYQQTVDVPVIGFFLPTSTGPILVPSFNLRFAWPAFDRARSEEAQRVDTVMVEVSDGTKCTLQLLENFNAVASNDTIVTGEQAFRRSVTRSTIRTFTTVVGGAAALIAAKTAYDSDGTALRLLAYTLALTSYEAAVALVDVAEQADVRQCTMLPGYAFAAGISLAPGTYTLTVRYYKNGALVGEEYHDGVTVRERRATLVEAACVR